MQPEPGKDRAETTEFIQSMLGQLRSMAQAEKLDMLAYLIEMAYLEAGEAVRGEQQAAKPGHKRSGAA